MNTDNILQQKDILWNSINALVLNFEKENDCLVVFNQTLEKKFDFIVVVHPASHKI